MEKEMKPKLVFRRQDRIDYVMNGVSDYYKISREELTRPTRAGARLKRKRIAVKILRDIADISYKEITYSFNQTSLPCIWRMLMDMTEDLNDHTSATKEIREEYKNVVNYLGL